MRLRFQKLSESARLPQRAHAHDAGLDLYSADSGVVRARGRLIVGCGVAVEIPAHFAGYVIPRSGLAARSGISVVNAPGLIDSGYRGELRVILLNTSDEDFNFDVGERIAQLVITPVELVESEFATELSVAEDGRGEGGFGSSGR